jgi:Protein of unknown function (DUF3187)
MAITYSRSLAWAAVALAQCALAQADNSSLDTPFASANRSPLVQIYGLPTAASAQLVPEGKVSSSLQVELANNFTENDSSGEVIRLDGETLRSNIQFRYGLNDHIELGLDIPWISHSGGSLDGFIEDWHEFWYLPEGGRPGSARNQLQYAYQKNGNSRVSLNSDSEGLGDISLSLAYQLDTSDYRQWALRAGLKLPTGDAEQLLGSDSTDLSLSLNVSDQNLSQNYGIALHASAGILLMDGGEVLDDLREDWLLYSSTTLSWSATPSLTLKLQLDGHTALYDSALTELGSNSAQVIMGGAVRLSEQWSLDLAVSEDIAVDTAPDVVFHLAIKRRGF